MSKEKNVLGTILQLCSISPKTGFRRDGYCTCNEIDYGQHTICVLLSKDFLDFSVKCGNDLVTPNPEYLFPGLKPGDQWCICLNRWIEAYEAGVAPKVILESTNESVLEKVSLSLLETHQA